MPVTTPLFLSLLLQVGPAPSTSPVTAVPEELYEQRRMNRARERAEVTLEDVDPVQACIDRADADPEAARFEARERFDRALGLDRAIAGHCLGIALCSDAFCHRVAMPQLNVQAL